MKNISRLFLFLSILILFTAMQCENEPFAYKTVYSEKLINIETKSNYIIYDSLFVNATFSRYIKETGFPNLLDVYKTSSSKAFNVNITIEKKNNNNMWEKLDIYANAVLIKGDLDYYGKATVLNPLNNYYEYKIAFPLLETGQFRMNVSETLRQSEYSEKIELTIFTNIEELNEEGFYYFTVN